MGIKGIDISHWQVESVFDCIGNTDIRFVIIKAGGSDTGQKDDRFENHYAKAKFMHLKVGAYFYGTPKSIEDAKHDAKFFVDECGLGGKTFDLPLFYDIEEQITLSKGEEYVCEIIRAFCNEVKRLMPSRQISAPNVGFYTYDGWAWYQYPYHYLKQLSKDFPFWYANLYYPQHMSDLEANDVKFYIHQYEVGKYINSTYPDDLDHDELLGKTFVVRKTPPVSSDKYIRFYKTDETGGLSLCCPGLYSKGGSYFPADVLPNCVGYACGRFNEIYCQVNGLSPNTMPYNYLNCDAGQFVNRAKAYKQLTVSEDPKSPLALGTIICLQGPSWGHVLIVEEIIDNETIMISESGWLNSDTMRYAKWHWNSSKKIWDQLNNYYSNNGYRTVGYIYNPAITGNTIPTSYEYSGAKLDTLTVQHK